MLPIAPFPGHSQISNVVLKTWVDLGGDISPYTDPRQAVHPQMVYLHSL